MTSIDKKVQNFEGVLRKFSLNTMDSLPTSNVLLKLFVFIVEIGIIVFNLLSFKKTPSTSQLTTRSIQTSPTNPVVEKRVVYEESVVKKPLRKMYKMPPPNSVYVPQPYGAMYSGDDYAPDSKRPRCVKCFKKLSSTNV